MSLLSQSIKEASSKTFYEMEKYSQLVIDLIDEIEDSNLDNLESRGALIYEIENVLEIIDPKRIDDIKVLTDLKLALRRN
jgi:hypothetical protein